MSMGMESFEQQQEDLNSNVYEEDPKTAWKGK